MFLIFRSVLSKLFVTGQDHEIKMLMKYWKIARQVSKDNEVAWSIYEWLE